MSGLAESPLPVSSTLASSRPSSTSYFESAPISSLPATPARSSLSVTGWPSRASATCVPSAFTVPPKAVSRASVSVSWSSATLTSSTTSFMSTCSARMVASRSVAVPARPAKDLAW